MNNIAKVVLISLVSLGLSSCSLFGPVKVDAPKKFVLDQIPNHLVVKHPRGGTVLVMAPETRQVYNTTQMAYSTKPFQVGYFSQNEWGETPAQMFHPLLVEALQKSHLFRAIVTPPFIGNYDYTLYTDITEIVQDYTVHPAVSIMSVRVVLARNISSQVVASAQFTVEEPIRPQSPYNGVLALNRASAAILNNLVNFCAKGLGRKR